MDTPLHHRSFDRDPSPGREEKELGAKAYKLLNLSLTAETSLILRKHGMPAGEIPTVGDMLSMILAPELPLLDRATDREREQWGGWAARLMVLYRQHVQSDDFLNAPIKTAQLVQFFDVPDGVPVPAQPFSRSDFDVLSFSSEIAHQLGGRVGGPDGPSLGRAFQFELRRCAPLVEAIAALAGDASRKLAGL